MSKNGYTFGLDVKKIADLDIKKVKLICKELEVQFNNKYGKPIPGTIWVPIQIYVCSHSPYEAVIRVFSSYKITSAVRDEFIARSFPCLDGIYDAV